MKSIMRLPSILTVSLAAFLVVFTLEAFAAVPGPDPKSGGRFFESKGTKAAADYEGRAGGPIYKYGEGIQFQALHLKPYVDLSHYWDDNVFLDEGGKKEDWITKIVPGFLAELPLQGGQHLAYGGAEWEIERFNRFEAQDHTDYTITAGLELNFVPFSLEIEEQFQRTVSRAGTEFTARNPREDNTIHALLQIPFSQFFLETEAIHFDVDFIRDADSGFDHTDLTLYQRVGFDIGPATQLLAEYGFLDIDYSEVADRDGDANMFSLGLRGNWTERITYQAWAGFQSRIYDEDSRPDFNGIILRGALRYELSSRSDVILRGARNPQESTFDGQSFYVRNRVELDWKQQLAERLYLKTGSAVQYNEYSRITTSGGDSETRRDWNWRQKIRLEYFMPNELISFYGQYQIKTRDSNTALLDYDNQTVTFGVKASF